MENARRTEQSHSCDPGMGGVFEINRDGNTRITAFYEFPRHDEVYPEQIGLYAQKYKEDPAYGDPSDPMYGEASVERFQTNYFFEFTPEARMLIAQKAVSEIYRTRILPPTFCETCADRRTLHIGCSWFNCTTFRETGKCLNDDICFMLNEDRTLATPRVRLDRFHNGEGSGYERSVVTRAVPRGERIMILYGCVMSSDIWLAEGRDQLCEPAIHSTRGPEITLSPSGLGSLITADDVSANAELAETAIGLGGVSTFSLVATRDIAPGEIIIVYDLGQTLGLLSSWDDTHMVPETENLE